MPLRVAPSSTDCSNDRLTHHRALQVRCDWAHCLHRGREGGLLLRYQVRPPHGAIKASQITERRDVEDTYLEYYITMSVAGHRRERAVQLDLVKA